MHLQDPLKADAQVLLRLPGTLGLPAPVTQLIGRDDAIAVGCDLLTSARLVTLTGPGGIGKTQLALAIARRLVDRFSDGVAFVELATVIDPDLVVPTIATALGLRGASIEPIDERLKALLRDRHLLLVLDNAEHLLGAAPAIAELLAACPQLSILVTSRAPLRLRGEHELDVLPLVTPPREHTPPPEELTRYPAVELFVRQAQATDAVFVLTEQNAAIVAAISRQLDGLPLAIELAAARVKVLPPDDILARLDAQLLLLTGGPRDQPARLQTMRSALAWSYELLDAGQQALFQRLAAFSGGWTLAAAAAVCQPEDDVLDAMASLVSCSLVRRIAQPTGEARFTMLEPIRQFALEQLVASGEIDAVRSRHADVYLALAEQAAPQLDRRDQSIWMNRLESEHHNLLVALSWLLDQRDADRGLRFITALSWFWNRRGLFSEGLQLAQAVLDLPEASRRTAARGRALGALAQLLYFLGDNEQAQPLGEEALAINNETGDRAGRVRILIPLIQIAAENGDEQRCQRRAEDLLQTARELGDQENVARALRDLGGHARRTGDTGRAQVLLLESLELSRRLEHPTITSVTLGDLGDVYYQIGNFPRAGMAYREGLAICVETNFQWNIARGLQRLASLACSLGQWKRSAQLYAAAAVRRAAIGSTVMPTHRAIYDRDLAAIHAALTDEQFQAAWERGEAMSFADAIVYALEADPAPADAQPSAEGTHPPPQRRPGGDLPAGLSQREAEVLRLVAQGLTDADVAEQLYIARRTVNSHLTSIYTKLGVSSRAAATRFAVEHGLT